MLRRTILAIIFLLQFSISTCLAAVDFIYPAPNSFVSKSNHLIFKINQIDITAIRITHNGVAGEPIDVGLPEYRKLFQDFFIAQTLWDNGRNDVIVDVYKGAQKIESAPLSIYFIPPGSLQKAPPEFSPIVMHTAAREALCQSCHNMNPSPVQMNSSIEKNNPCFGCHKKMLVQKYVHGPVGTYSCGYCHASKGNPKHAVPKTGAGLCYECHADMSTQLKKQAFVHGPVEAGMCDACHDPHGSSYESQLRAPINEVCLSCHGHIRNQVHIIRISSGGGHPLKGGIDPAKKGSGREMSCISCHSPHGGAVRYFFVNKAEDRMQLCQMCHNK
ncbi:MAG: cytochrome c3 family protein [Desulfuromonadales bacterium]